MFTTEEIEKTYIKLSESFIEAIHKSKNRSKMWAEGICNVIEIRQSEMPSIEQMDNGAWYEFDVISETENNVVLGAGQPIALVLDIKINKKSGKITKFNAEAKEVEK